MTNSYEIMMLDSQRNRYLDLLIAQHEHKVPEKIASDFNHGITPQQHKPHQYPSL